MNKKSKHFMYTAVAAAGIFTTAMILQVRVATTIVASYRYVTRTYRAVSFILQKCKVDVMLINSRLCRKNAE
ncbi:hypothetical protein SAMN04488574_1045 [Bacillus sp. 71mf]|nr:hypothetical protein SAMN04488574_1045 [Bacillus sp. 71mf]SFS90127.1 hypothetical protein SAMN04488145_104361 [Bacillus sp. 103mf]